MASPILQVRRGPASNIGIASLRAGEPGFTTDLFDFYIGTDGTADNQEFFGSSRYWGRENGSVAAQLKLLDKNGSNGIHLKAPDTLAGIGTYTFPDTSTIQPGYFLRVGAGGTLSWESVTASASFENVTLSGTTSISGTLTNSANSTNSGITTFSNTTDNTLGNVNTGAVQIDGGVGIERNLTVGAGLSVAGTSHFIGTATFYGGTINLGDSDTDDVVFGGEIKSNLIPTDDATYDIGSGAKRWRNASFSGVGTFATGAVVDAVQIGITAAGEIDTTTGSLTLDSASGQTIIDDNLSITGIATVTGAFVANGNVTLGDDSGDTITIKGTTTFEQPLVGTIGTATKATLVDTTTAPSGTFYPGLFVNNTGTASTAVYVDSGISYVSNTDTLALTGNIAVNGGDVTTSATTFNLVNGTATNVNLAGAATALNMGAATGIASINNATLTLPNATAVNVNGSNPTLAGSSTGTLTLFNTNLTGVNAFQAATNIVIGADTGITTFRNSVRISDSLYDSTNSTGSSGQFLISTVSGIGWTTVSGVSAGTISTATRANTVDIIDNAADTVKILFGNTGTASTVYNNTNLTYNASTNTLNSSNLIVSGDIRTPAIKAFDGTSALSISNTTGDVVSNSNFTVTGNLIVNGSTTQVNTTELQVNDRTITLGIQTGTTPTTTTWDLGILMNYGDAGIAKTAGMIWDYATRRFRFGTDTDNPAGTSTTTPQIGITTFAPIEIAELWVNNSCVSNTATRVVGCTDGALILENITIDAGSF